MFALVVVRGDGAPISISANLIEMGGWEKAPKYCVFANAHIFRSNDQTGMKFLSYVGYSLIVVPYEF